MPIPVRHVIHLNLNVAALDEGLRFLGEVAGLQALGHMRAEPQDGAGFGMDDAVQWDGHSLHDHRHWAGTMIDLLEWQLPPTTGDARRPPGCPGHERLLLRAPALDAMRRRAAAHGVDCLHADDARVLLRNRDGALLEARRADGPVEIAGVVSNCRSLDHTAAWYRVQLGFEALADAVVRTEPGSLHGLEAPVRFREQALALPASGVGGFRVVLREWLDPAPSGEPPRAANQSGFYRIALAVADAHACHAALLAAGVDCPWPPAWLNMGPDVPIEGLWALFFRDPDGTCVELIQDPVPRAG